MLSKDELIEEIDAGKIIFPEDVGGLYQCKLPWVIAYGDIVIRRQEWENIKNRHLLRDELIREIHFHKQGVLDILRSAGFRGFYLMDQHDIVISQSTWKQYIKEGIPIHTLDRWLEGK